MPTLEQEKKHLINSAALPLAFVALIWLLKIAETLLGANWANWGIYPRTLSGLKGLLTYPLVHGNWEHLLSNTMPLLVLGFLFMSSYRVVAMRVLPAIYLASGLGIWLIGRESSHIGASGVVYGLAFFLFFSGVWRKDRQSMALSAFVAIFYGGMTWGLYPMEEGVSWEGHLAGAAIGALCAYRYRHINPPPRYEWELNSESVDEGLIVEHPFWVPLPTSFDEPSDEDSKREGEMPTDHQPTEKREDIPATPNETLHEWAVKYHFVPNQPPTNDDKQS